MKYLKYLIYFLILITFIYIITHLNESINVMSITLVNFFKSLLPYLLIFLIINQLLIKTKLIYLISSFLEYILYPPFKINSNEIALILISLLNGFPSSYIYSSIMQKNHELDGNQIKRIANIFFLPSYTFIFYLIRKNLSVSYFNILVTSLYIPCIITLILTRNNSTSKFNGIVKSLLEIKKSLTNFNYIETLKEIFINTLYTIVNILGMISFYSLITLIIPSLFIKGIFEFSMSSISILNSSLTEITKTYLLLIILVFSSISSISQAAIYFENTNMNTYIFIKKRITMLSLSLLIFTLLLFSYFL